MNFVKVKGTRQVESLSADVAETEIVNAAREISRPHQLMRRQAGQGPIKRCSGCKLCALADDRFDAAAADELLVKLAASPLDYEFNYEYNKTASCVLSADLVSQLNAFVCFSSCSSGLIPRFIALIKWLNNFGVWSSAVKFKASSSVWTSGLFFLIPRQEFCPQQALLPAAEPEQSLHTIVRSLGEVCVVFAAVLDIGMVAPFSHSNR